MGKKNINVYCLTHNKHFKKEFFARILIIVQVENVLED